MNPPYGREIGFWVKKAYEESIADNCKVVALLPSRTDTKYFHKYIYKIKGVKIIFLKGRIKFSGSKNSAPFPSMLVEFNRGKRYEGNLSNAQDTTGHKQFRFEGI